MSRGSLSTGSSRSLENSSEGEALLRPHRNAWHARYLRLAVLGACLAFLLTLTLGAASALAVTAYVPAGEFARETLGPVPTGIAVDDATGHVLVVDSENNRVVVFESGEAGAGVLTTFGEGELSAPSGIAIDQTNGDVYVSDAGNNRIVRYTTDGAPVPTYTLDIGYTSPTQGAGAAQVGSFASPLAIDPLTGDLLVADTGNLRVERFDSGGAFLGSFDGASTPSGAFTSLFSIATGPDGTIYLIADGTIEPYSALIEGSIVESFAPDGTLDEVMRGGGGQTNELGFARTIAYDPRLENVLITTDGSIAGPGLRPLLVILHGGKAVGQVVLPAAEITETAGIAVPQSLAAPISVLGTRNVEFGEGAAGVSAVKAVILEVTTPTVSAVGSSGAHLAATVNPHGNGGSASYEVRRAGSESWIVNPEHALAAETAAEPVEEDLTELLPNETYEARLTATVLGISDTSAVETFKTVAVAPGVVTLQATGISATGATLNGSVNPNGDASFWFFEYGATSAYGARVPLAATSAGVGRVPKNFSRAIGGLTPGSTYHYRIVAENAVGVVYGVDRTFAASTAPPEGRAYEQVTPVDAGGVNPDPVAGPLPLSTGISYLVRPAGAGTAASPYNPRQVALRGESDWEAPINVDPKISSPAVERLWRTTLGISADGTHALVVTDEKLTPGALEGNTAGNLYIKDLRSGSVRFVGAAPGALEEFTNSTHTEMFVAAADDFSWVVFYSSAPLLNEVHHGAIYRWTSSAGLEVLSKLADNSVPSIGVQEAMLGSINDFVRRSVSADGSTLLFGLADGSIYLRHDNVTVPIPLPQIEGQAQPVEAISTDLSGRYAYYVMPGNAYSTLFRYDSQTGHVDEVGRASGPAVLDVSEDGNSALFTTLGPEGEVQLVVWHEGETKLVMRGEVTASLNGSARLSPDGRYVAFMANKYYDEANTLSNLGDVYLYDTLTEELTCASCPGGQPDRASILPVSQPLINNRMQQYVDNKGQVFFTSYTSLTPSDVNDVMDVYVFQDGRVSLISPGDGPYPARLVDISPDGHDVYFATTEGLVAQDNNREPDLYDARVGGGFAIQNQPPAAPCDGEACQGPPRNAPMPGSAASEALTGAVSRTTPAKPKPATRAQKLAKALKACRAKHNKHKRQNCERAAREKFGAKSKPKAKSHKGGK